MHTTFADERIRLRPYQSTDEVEAQARALHLSPIPGWGPLWHTLPGLTRDWEEYGWMDASFLGFVIEERASGQAMGYFDIDTIPYTLDCALGTFILPQFRRQGFGVAAKRLGLCAVFENTQCARASAITLSNHPAAIRGLELCGFKLEGRLRGKFFSEGQHVDKLVYCYTREMWEAQEYRHSVKRG
jgi:RimJ/RimL family protein N-acetyltransferase